LVLSAVVSLDSKGRFWTVTLKDVEDEDEFEDEDD
jgi:hypothetical protein